MFGLFGTGVLYFVFLVIFMGYYFHDILYLIAKNVYSIHAETPYSCAVCWSGESFMPPHIFSFLGLFSLPQMSAGMLGMSMTLRCNYNSVKFRLPLERVVSHEHQLSLSSAEYLWIY